MTVRFASIAALIIGAILALAGPASAQQPVAPCLNVLNTATNKISCVPWGTAPIGSRTSVSFSSSGDNTLVAAIAGKSIWVMGIALSCQSAVNLIFKSGATNQSGAIQCGAVTLDLPSDGSPWIITNPGEALVVNASSSVSVGGILRYQVK